MLNGSPVRLHIRTTVQPETMRDDVVGHGVTCTVWNTPNAHTHTHMSSEAKGKLCAFQPSISNIISFTFFVLFLFSLLFYVVVVVVAHSAPRISAFFSFCLCFVHQIYISFASSSACFFFFLLFCSHCNRERERETARGRERES